METYTVSFKRSFLIGCLLGDAHSRPRNRKTGKLQVEFCITHSLAQQDLVEWKAAIFRSLWNPNLKVCLYPQWNKASFSVTSGGRLRVIHDWFFKERKKTITDKIRFMDHPIGLAILLCDDGSVLKRKKTHADGSIYYLKPALTIATHCFARQDVERLLLHIDKLCGARGYINIERKWRKGIQVEYQRVRFNSTETEKLWNYVRDFIPSVPSMQQKFKYMYESFNS